MFKALDKDGSGSLDVDEIRMLCVQMKDSFKNLEPPFDLESDWELMDTQFGEVSFPAFEKWYALHIKHYIIRTLLRSTIKHYNVMTRTLCI